MTTFVLVALLLTGGSSQRRVAFTFDDLPGLYLGSNCDVDAHRRLNERLVAAIRRNKMPALGVVNEGKLCAAKRDETTALLKIWLDAGLEVGNHTFSHIDFNDTSLADFQQDILNGETYLRPLLKSRGQAPRYFRFPFLHSGKDLAKKRALDRFLRDRGYRHAVVTIDNDDYIYATVYAGALRRSDRALAQRVADDYIRYMESIFAFYEKFSQDAFGYEPAQILLLHDNQLNVDTLDRLAAMTKKRGYSFVSVGEALKDPIYKRPDNYVAGNGISWLQRWAIEDGKTIPTQPDVPKWIMDLFRAR